MSHTAQLDGQLDSGLVPTSNDSANADSEQHDGAGPPAAVASETAAPASALDTAAAPANRARQREVEALLAEAHPSGRADGTSGHARKVVGAGLRFAKPGAFSADDAAAIAAKLDGAAAEWHPKKAPAYQARARACKPSAWRVTCSMCARTPPGIFDCCASVQSCNRAIRCKQNVTMCTMSIGIIF